MRVMPCAERVHVAVRLRPLLAGEAHEHFAWAFTDTTLSHDQHAFAKHSAPHSARGTQSQWYFDQVLGPAATDLEVYVGSQTKSLVHSTVKEGLNGLVFAYGELQQLSSVLWTLDGQHQPLTMCLHVQVGKRCYHSADVVRVVCPLCYHIRRDWLWQDAHNGRAHASCRGRHLSKHPRHPTARLSAAHGGPERSIG
jgi:hypothetical protein